MKKAIFAGSFDPFHNGHLEVVKKAASLFDEVHIVIAKNPKKNQRKYNHSEMYEAVKKTLEIEGLTNCVITVVSELISEYAIKIGAGYLVRGIRNNMDYNYEENMAQGNKIVYPEIETIYFRADKSALSSSLINELHEYGVDVSAFVPAPIYHLMCSNRNK